jgi:hypothetical protein
MQSERTTWRSSACCIPSPPDIPSSTKRPASSPPPVRSARAWAMPWVTRSPARWPRRSTTPPSTPSSTTTSSPSLATAAFRKAWRVKAVSLRRPQQLDNLILIFDSNDVTLDAMAKVTQSEDTAGALHRHRLGRRDHRRSRPRRQIEKAIETAKKTTTASPRSSSPRPSSAKASLKSPAPPRATAKAEPSSSMQPKKGSACQPKARTSTSAMK